MQMRWQRISQRRRVTNLPAKWGGKLKYMLRRLVRRRRLLSRCFATHVNGVVLSEEVAEAVQSRQPVVVLESTIISHGMPFPQNLETGNEVESIVRSEGAIPATVAVLDGQLHVGLTSSQIEQLARAGTAARKCSRRDLPVALARGEIGATTVSGTMVAADLAGVRTFVTGGIGGVHRGAESTMDISADLVELGRTPVAVICAGIKSILDIPRSLEVLETHGVTVASLAADDFPAFFLSSSGVPSPLRVESVDDAASIWQSNRHLNLRSGMLLAVPNPFPHAEEALLEGAVQRALREANERGIVGHAVTPFLLQRVNELTHGKSLESNISLIRHNAAVGAQFAVACTRQQGLGTVAAAGKSRATPGKRFHHTSAAAAAAASTDTQVPESNGTGEEGGKVSSVLVLGGALLDVTARPHAGGALATSYPGTVRFGWGGVGRNIAEGVARHGGSPTLVTRVGDDVAGSALREACRTVGIALSDPWHDESSRSPAYVATLSAGGELVTAVADTEALDSLAQEGLDDPATKRAIQSASSLVIDGNIPVATRHAAMRLAQEADPPIPVVCEPTSVPKAKQLGRAETLAQCALVKPNVDECIAMAHAFREQFEETQRSSDPDGFQALAPLGAKTKRFIPSEEPDAPPASSSPPSAAAMPEDFLARKMALESRGIDPENIDLSSLDLAGIPWDDPAIQESLREYGLQQSDVESFLETHTGQAASSKPSPQTDKSETANDTSAVSNLDKPMHSGLDDVSWASAFGVEAPRRDLASMYKTRKQPASSRSHRPSSSPLPSSSPSSSSSSSTPSNSRGVQTSASSLTASPPTASSPATDDWLSPELMEAALWVFAGMANPGSTVANVACIDGEKHVLVTAGRHGVLWVHGPVCATQEAFHALLTRDFFSASIGSFDFVHLKAPETTMVDCTGAGDSLVAGVLFALEQGWTMHAAVLWGMAAAKLSVESDAAISPALSDAHCRREAVRAVCRANTDWEPARDLLAVLEST